MGLFHNLLKFVGKLLFKIGLLTGFVTKELNMKLRYDSLNRFRQVTSFS